MTLTVYMEESCDVTINLDDEACSEFIKTYKKYMRKVPFKSKKFDLYGNEPDLVYYIEMKKLNDSDFEDEFNYHGIRFLMFYGMRIEFYM